MDRNARTAFLNGLLISVDPKIDLSVVQRVIDQKYQAVNANAFTENTSPTNERGLYTGISIRPVTNWRLDLYADVYEFPWLKFQVDAPSQGRDFLAQLTYSPNRVVEISTRFKNEEKQSKHPDNAGPTNYLVYVAKKNWRTQINYTVNPAITLRNRVEAVWLKQAGEKGGSGFLSFFDFLYKPLHKPYSGVVRLQYFETEGYNSRLYAYENDVLYGYSIPVFYDKGFRYYVIWNYDITKEFSFWLRWAQTVYVDKTSIGSGPEEITGNKKSEIKLQLRWLF